MMFDTIDCKTTSDGIAAGKSYAERPASVLELKHLRTYTLGMADLEREILGLFLEQLPKSQAALNGAASAKDWHMAAHTLKGSALAVGANRLASIGAAAEATDCTAGAARAAVLTQVAQAIDEVEAEISRLGLI